MFISYNSSNNKQIGSYFSLKQCAKHIKKVDSNMIKENKSLLDVYITLNDEEISEEYYKIYRDYYNNMVLN